MTTIPQMRSRRYMSVIRERRLYFRSTTNRPDGVTSGPPIVLAITCVAAVILLLSWLQARRMGPYVSLL